MSSKAVTELVRTFLKTSGGFHTVLDKVNIIKAGSGNCLAELKVAEEHTNPMGTLHGGLSATLVDSLTTSALVTHENCGPIPNVSVDLHMTYLKGAAIGDEIIIDSTTERVGKTLAYLKCEIKNKSTGELLAKGTHTKFIMRPKDTWLE